MVGLLEDSLDSSDNESEFSLLTPDSEASKDDDLVYLSVGGQTFVTMADTLQESEYLRQLTSQSIDKRCFVDADPELFKHILRYLRHGQYPLFYQEGSGFDYGKYNDLLLEAEQLKIRKLANWIEHEAFKKLVKVDFQISTLKDIDPDNLQLPSHLSKPYSVKILSTIEKRYVCPRDIPLHKEPSKCGKKCLVVQALAGTVGPTKHVCPRDIHEEPFHCGKECWVAQARTIGPKYIDVPCKHAEVTTKTITIDREAMVARKPRE